MPAKLELLPRKSFELTLSDGSVIPGQFGTWSLKRFGEKRKMGLSQISELFYKPEVDGQGIVINKADVSVSDMIDFVLCAIEYKEREAGKPVSFNDLKLCAWIDDYTAETGESGVLTTLFSHAGGESKKDEKKNQEGLNGTNYNESSIAQA